MAQFPSDSLLVRGGRVVTPQGVVQSDVAVIDGQIAAIGEGLS